MPELQQRVLDNLFSDVFLASVLFLVSAYGLYRLAKIWKVPLLPLAVLLPSFVGVGLTLYLPLSPLYVRSDGELYQQWGYSLAASWISGEPADVSRAIWPGKGLWPLIIGAFTSVAGPVTITLVVFNALILVLTVIVLQKATLILGGRAPRWSIVIVFLSSTPFLLWGPSLLREALFWVGVALGVLALTYASVRRYRSALPAASLSSLMLLGIRPDAGIVLIYGFVAMLIFLFGVASRKTSWFRMAATFAALLPLALSFSTAFEFVRGKELSGPSLVNTNRSLANDGVTTSFGVFAEPSEPSEPSEPWEPSEPSEPWEPSELVCGSEFAMISSVTAAFCTASVNLPYALFGPFHWEYGPGAIWLIAGASTLHFLVLVSLATYDLVISRGRRGSRLALLAVAAASILMFSSVLTNYGILIRFRAATEVVLIPLALSGALALFAKVKSRRRNRLP